MRVLYFLAALLCSACLLQAEADVESLIAKLSSDSFREREQATEKLLEQGPEIVPLLKPLMESKDPELQGRVQTLLDTILYQIPPGTTQELRDKLIGFKKLDEEARKEVLETVALKGTSGILTLASLHTRMLGTFEGKEAEQKKVCAAISEVMKQRLMMEKFPLERVHPSIFSAETLALFLKLGKQDKIPEEMRNHYVRWSKVRPKLKGLAQWAIHQEIDDTMAKGDLAAICQLERHLPQDTRKKIFEFVKKQNSAFSRKDWQKANPRPELIYFLLTQTLEVRLKTEDPYRYGACVH